MQDQAQVDDKPALTGRDSSNFGGDLTACDREPIHIPGAIQPHGLLLVVDTATMKVIGGAGDIEGRLSPDWLDRDLAALLGRDPLPAFDPAAPGPHALSGVMGTEERFEAILHIAGGLLLVELEPQDPGSASTASILLSLDAISGTFERASDLKTLCNAAAHAFRELTGFDRVMIYRFLDDDAGVVLAESLAPELGSFLNHHFPASDIPRQARALYVRNRARVIPDVSYQPAPLRPAERWRDLDLSDVALRSVSPVHLRYLVNMGVAASASVSIVKDGVLWGLIACHHRSAHRMSPGIRTAAVALAGGLARQIRAKENAELYRDRVRLRSAEDAVVARLGTETALPAFIAETGADLMRMMGADGFAALQGRELVTAGRVPGDEMLREIGTRFAAPAMERPIATDTLGTLHPPATVVADRAAGLLATTMSTEEPTILMWFRAEQIEEVNWAGNPHKAVEIAPGEVLTPRSSFEAWSEEVRGRARPWSLAEVEAAARLKRALFEARQARRLREVNRELTATVADKDALIVQKDFLMREVNHRVQNSLQLVSSFLGLQSRSAGDPELSGHLDEAQRRLAAVALVHRRLYADDRIETVDLGRYLDDLLTEMGDTMDTAWKSHMLIDLHPILISTDRAVNVGLILTELVINANKYAYAGEPGPITVSLEPIRNRFRLIVADQGGGKTGDRTGFGSRMVSAMVTRLSGTIEEEPAHPGLRVIVTAPIQEG